MRLFSTRISTVVKRLKKAFRHVTPVLEGTCHPQRPALSEEDRVFTEFATCGQGMRVSIGTGSKQIDNLSYLPMNSILDRRKATLLLRVTFVANK